jgi:hypothetical protein
MKAVGTDSDHEAMPVDKARCRFAKVRVNMEIEKTQIGKRADLIEDTIMEEVIKPAEAPEGVQTRSQKAKEKKRKSEEIAIGVQEHVLGTEGISESHLKRLKEIEIEETSTSNSKRKINICDSMHNAMMNEKSEERGLRVYGPIVPTESVLSKWAWGTGSTEVYPDDERDDIWSAHGMNPRVNYIQRKELLEKVGINPMSDKSPETHLLHFHIWPGPTEISMPPNEVFGWEVEAKILYEYRMMMEAEDPKMRRGYLEEMCRTRLRIHEIQRDILYEDDGIDARMHQDVKYWWNYIQEYEVWWKLQKSLEDFGHDPQTERMGHAEFQLKYEQMVSDYTTRTSDFELPTYDEDVAQREHLHTFDVVGYDVMGQEQYSSPALAQVYARGLPFGLTHAPMVYRRQIEAQIVRQEAPDWIVPPEGNHGDAGIAPMYDRGGQDNRIMDVAGLPIPEGCLDRGPFRSWNGQSESGDV